MEQSACLDCGLVLPDDRFPHCFKCRVKTISVSYPYGQKFFHGQTIKERIAHEKKDLARCAAEGNTFEPKPVRSVLI
jgi:hypothetical protein